MNLVVRSVEVLDVENKRAALIVDWSNFVSSCEGGAGRGEADQDNLITESRITHHPSLNTPVCTHQSRVKIFMLRIIIN